MFISLKEFTKNVNYILKQKANTDIISAIQEKYMIDNRLDHSILTIDPQGSLDLDDAVSIRGNILSIYIANVPLLIEGLNLWNSFSQRVSTIYLPDRKYTMLPSILSDNVCSLLENENRLTFCMDIIIENDNINIKFCNALIKVRKNYVYDDPDLNDDIDYQKILKISQILHKKYNYIEKIRDSHDLIAFLMILMNSECANKMNEFKCGIFRGLTIKPSNTQPNTQINEITNFIKIWQSSSGQYVNYENKIPHDLISNGLENYIHITSPIRRLVDLLNIMELQSKLNLIEFSELAIEFQSSWLKQLKYINSSMQAIRKIQTDCNMLYICIAKPVILNTIYDGYIFDKIQRPNKYNQYTLYIPGIKIITRVNIKEDLSEYSCHKFKLYLIENGVTLKRKIRAEIQ